MRSNNLGLRTAGALTALLLLLYTMVQLRPPSSHLKLEEAGSSLGFAPVRKNVVVASRFGAHFDVYMAAVWTLGRVMTEGSLRVYPDGPFRFDFQTIVDSYGLYNGTANSQYDFLKDVGDDEDIDLIILGTCEIDLRPEWNSPLLKIWDTRDAAHKFKLVCIVHNVKDTAWQENISPWSRRNAIRLLPISSHVGKAFREKFLSISRNPDVALRSAGYEYIPIDAHVPILDVPDLPSLPSRTLSNAVIQGSFEKVRRDYTNVFADLNQSLSVDPGAWGYVRSEDGTSFIEDPTQAEPPFKLHLVGHGTLDVPKELKELVVFHTNLGYPDFYRLMGGMDICVPAFVHNEIVDYYKYQASSTITMCTEANLPILGVQQLRDAYTYIDDDAVTITRPAVMSEIEALKALRNGDAAAFLASDPSSSGITMGSHLQVREDVERMVNEGWVRPKAGFDACKERTWMQNEKVMRKLLSWK